MISRLPYARVHRLDRRATPSLEKLKKRREQYQTLRDPMVRYLELAHEGHREALREDVRRGLYPNQGERILTFLDEMDEEMDALSEEFIRKWEGS